MAEGEKTLSAPVDRYEGIKKDIADKLRVYENEYFRWDKPVPFCGLLVYPATLIDYETFLSCSSVFTLNRKEDAKGVSMTNLGFLYYKMQKQDTEDDQKEATTLSYYLQKICEVIFHIQNGLKCKKCDTIMSYDGPEFKKYVQEIRDMADKIEKQGAELTATPKLSCPKCGEEKFLEMIKIIVDPTTGKESLLVDGHVISSKDFDLLRYLVLYQNFSDYRDDSWVDPDIKADYEERMKIEQQKSNDVHASLEKKMVALHISTGVSLDEIYHMTIRKFTMALGTVEDLINYKIMKSASMSGFVSLPKGTTIDHWIYKKDKDMYGDIYKDVDKLKEEVNQI